jgi:hypothetical protein
MKKLAYLLMALGLVFFVSCNKNSGQGSMDYEKTQVANKWQGSPAFVEYMTFLDEIEAKVEKCKSCDELEDLGDEFDEGIEALEEKYPDYEPAGKEKEQMSQKAHHLFDLIVEQEKKMGCLDEEDLDDLWSDLD